jgi:hypothetical protein
MGVVVFGVFRRAGRAHVVAALVAAAACGGLYWAGAELAARADAAARERSRLLASGAPSRIGERDARQVSPNDPAAASIPPGRTIVHGVARSGASLGVAVSLAAAAPAVGAAGPAGRTELSLQLRGTYSDTKLLLAETLDRYPALVVSRVSARATGTTAGEVETLVNVLVPQPAGAGEPSPHR